MNMMRRLIMMCLLASLSPTVLADDLCEGNAAAKNKADAQLRQAESLEKSGRVREAYAAAQKADADCVSSITGLEAVMKRAAATVAKEEEKKSRYQEAFEWYQRAQNSADAGRMQRTLVKTRPDDINTVSHAIDFFRHTNDAEQEKAMRAHAAKNVDKALADEEKHFATVAKNSLQALGRARDWVHYAGNGRDHVVARAEKRGDTLIAEDGRRFLELALDYYGFAEKRDKQQKVRDKARSLGERALSNGKAELAVEYFQIAGDNAKAEAVEKQHEAQAQQAEEKRKKSFKKDQEQLEKELGL